MTKRVHVEEILHNLVTKKIDMKIVAGKSEWVAIFMATVNFARYQNKMATNKMVTVAASSLRLFVAMVSILCSSYYFCPNFMKMVTGCPTLLLQPW